MTVDHPIEPLPVKRAGQLETIVPGQSWLIRSLWGRDAVGILGGPPKSCKSYLGLEIATSVAAGTPALDHFPIDRKGPALVYLAEDALPLIRSRLEAICDFRGLDLNLLDLHVICVPVLRLDLQRDQQRLTATIDQIRLTATIDQIRLTATIDQIRLTATIDQIRLTATIDQIRLTATIDHIRPRLLLLDPLVRLHRLDENCAQEVAAILASLPELQRRQQIAITLVHHTRKNGGSRQPGQALRGSGDFHAWADSALYLSHEQAGLRITIEQRAAPAPEPFFISLADRPPHPVISAPAQESNPSLQDRILCRTASWTPCAEAKSPSPGLPYGASSASRTMDSVRFSQTSKLSAGSDAPAADGTPDYPSRVVPFPRSLGAMGTERPRPPLPCD